MILRYRCDVMNDFMIRFFFLKNISTMEVSRPAAVEEIDELVQSSLREKKLSQFPTSNFDYIVRKKLFSLLLNFLSPIMIASRKLFIIRQFSDF